MTIVFQCLCLTLGIYVGGRLGHATAYTQSHISLIWLPTGIAVAALFRWGLRFWPAVYFGACLVQLEANPSILLGGSVAIGSTLGPFLVALILRRIAFDPSFGHRRDVTWLVVAAVVGMLVPATIGVSCLRAAGVIRPAEVGSTWAVWWMGDTVGVLLAAPGLMALSRQNLGVLSRRRGEVFVLTLLFAFASWSVFFLPDRFADPIAAVILIIWASMRFGALGGSLVVLAVSMLTAWATATGRGPFRAEPSELLACWLAMCTWSVINLVIAAIQAVGIRANKALNESLQRLQRLAADLAVSKDVAEGALRETEALRSILDENSLVSISDARGKIVEVNPPFCRLSGHARDDLLGKDHRILNSGLHSRAFWAEMWVTILAKRPWRNQVCNRAKDGSVYWVDVTIAPFVGPDGRIEKFVSIANDITARKRDEIALIEARHAADAASRAKSEFLANMSHEIRTPLTAILGYADMLADHPDVADLPERRNRIVDSIRSAGQHLLTILNDILDLSKIEADKMTIEKLDTPLIAALLEVERMVRPRAESKRVVLTTRLTTPIPERVMSDPTRLRQILLNVLGNATKFTETGRVTMIVGVESRAPMERLVIEIEDTGPGMTREQAGRLFAAFSQADTSVTREHGGTGLGLVISQRLARLMGGDLTLAWSQVGKGSRFRLDLPLNRAPGTSDVSVLDARALGRRIESPAQVASLSGRILLAEDGIEIQKVIAFHLRRAGAEVDLAENGQLALEMLDRAESEQNPYRLLLTDSQMPIIDGFALARTLRSRGSTLPIIALTAHSMAEDRQLCLESGCNDYLSKPIDRGALIKTCSTWMARPT